MQNEPQKQNPPVQKNEYSNQGKPGIDKDKIKTDAEKRGGLPDKSGFGSGDKSSQGGK